ncbi:MAG: TIGR03905 family TSCPD domain-containing protein [Eubacteriales bacterium]|nr:TIGR03905 family TSCPD domain-containing protein [Eubacteriales bacterium]
MSNLTKQNNTYVHKNRGVCSSSVQFEIENGCVKNVRFEGGCNGNTTGVSRLAEGMGIEDVITRLEGIKCGFRPTSCPDQLAQALKAYLAESNA